MANRAWSDVGNLFALIIGIDNYEHATTLKGAVADANKFEWFLRKQVHARSDRIINLRNKGATRTNIVKAFHSLWDNDVIKYGDPIIIYFAGHGCTIRQPKEWETGEQTCTGIFPQDVQPQESSTRTIFPILDHTIGVWLAILSQKKGNNITVIFDCGYSAGIARGDATIIGRVRGQEFHGDIPKDIDRDTLRKTVGFGSNRLPSHVFLAACSDNECAMEEHRRGKFTTALLKALSEGVADRWTFIELMRRLKSITPQTPQCFGQLKNRQIFSDTQKIHWGEFPVSRQKLDSGGQSNHEIYRIEGGIIHGVDKNSILEMYMLAAADATSNQLLCTLCVQEVFEFHSIAIIQQRSEVDMTESGFARLIGNGDALKVHFSAEFLKMVDQRGVLRDIKGVAEVAKDEESADFIVDIKNENVVSTTTLKHVADHGFRSFPLTVPPESEHVSRLLLAASRLKQHLKASPPAPWINDIHVEFHRLELRDHLGITFQPIGTPQLNDGDNIVNLVSSPSKRQRDYFGMAIRNETELDLYVTMIAFDAEALDFERLFRSRIGVGVNGDADPPLRRGGNLTIGYGDGGGIPFAFSHPKASCNVTFLKLYFSTTPLDLRWFEHESPFSDRGFRNRNEEDVKVVKSPEQVATTLLTFVQRKTPS